MNIFKAFRLFLFPLILLFSGKSIITIQGFSYDYSATTECLAKPRRVHNGGGIIVNPKFNNGIEGWKVFGEGEIKQGWLKQGNYINTFIIAHKRTHPRDSFHQLVHLQHGNLYSFSAWVRLSEGNAHVAVLFRNSKGGQILHGGETMAKHGCWSLLKGGIVSNFTGQAELIFESTNTAVEIWVDNVSLQPFTKEQWRSHQEKSINKVRKSKVRLQITQADNSKLAGAKVFIDQKKPNFPFGAGMNYHILLSKEYQQWFASRFSYATFTNELKWYSTEKVEGQENYTIPDAMLEFSQQHGISVRGHNIFWDNPKFQPQWVKSLSPKDLKVAADRRINSVVKRYSGKFIHWDVVNENVHFRFFEDKLGENASAEYFNIAHKLDNNTLLFMNEYNTMEHDYEKTSTPANFRKKLLEILSYPGNENILAGIGLQGNFGPAAPNLPYMRSALDLLGSTGYPIWITEVFVHKTPNQAQYYEEVLREGYSHPAVKGIITFAGPESAGFTTLPLVDMNFKNTPAGDVVDKLLAEWKSPIFEITADDEGFVDASLFHGDYNVTVQHPRTNSSISVSIRVTEEAAHRTLNVQLRDN
ncbi:endo-1,4-beta-xylanase 5-like [Benincasa hispida]|uniref:endo-1,4-beta-xylanase 5-like n=1 Tax=Benincasa hispida TaxID=102211 RepID=UPI001901E5EC|nr:endo-1,4-beta-xylanase 5-like [Benincasa hispida]